MMVAYTKSESTSTNFLHGKHHSIHGTRFIYVNVPNCNAATTTPPSTRLAGGPTLRHHRSVPGDWPGQRCRRPAAPAGARQLWFSKTQSIARIAQVRLDVESKFDAWNELALYISRRAKPYAHNTTNSFDLTQKNGGEIAVPVQGLAACASPPCALLLKFSKGN